MNCTEFHKLLMQDPARTEAEFLQHASDCDACREEYDGALAFEAMLLEAVDINAPEGLGERIATVAQSNHQPGGRDGMYRVALAASFTLLFVLAGWMGFQWGGEAAYAERLPQVVLQHIEKEQQHLQAEGQLSETAVARLFARFGAVMHTSMGEVAFAEPCWIRHQHGMHLILSEASGPVTLMFMPGEYTDAAQRFVWGRSSGLIVPTDYGSLAIVAATPAMVSRMRRRVDAALMWSS